MDYRRIFFIVLGIVTAKVVIWLVERKPWKEG